MLYVHSVITWKWVSSIYFVAHDNNPDSCHYYQKISKCVQQQNNRQPNKESKKKVFKLDKFTCEPFAYIVTENVSVCVCDIALILWLVSFTPIWRIFLLCSVPLSFALICIYRLDAIVFQHFYYIFQYYRHDNNATLVYHITCMHVVHW